MEPDALSAAEARALDWVIRQRDSGFDDWDAFGDWLAEDPGHVAVYDAIASLDADLDALPAQPKPSIMVREQRSPSRPSRRAWIGGGLVAALVAMVAIPNLGLLGNPDRIETAAGEHRTVNLADGSTIEINGRSVLTLDSDRPRFARLESGEAMFHVVHRQDDPFVVEAGDARIVDLGTAFNVVRNSRATSVAVAEGLVAYNPSSHNIRLAAGQSLVARDGDAKPPVLRNIDAANVGGWRTGLLVYADTPLSLVAEDLMRTAGMSVTVAPEVADRSFHGALVIAADRERTIADLAGLSGTRAERRGGGWFLTR